METKKSAICRLQDVCMEKSREDAKKGARAVLLGMRVLNTPWQEGKGASALPVEPYDATLDPDIDPSHFGNVSIKYARGIEKEPHMTVLLADTGYEEQIEEVRQMCEDAKIFEEDFEAEITSVGFFNPRRELEQIGFKGTSIWVRCKIPEELWVIHNMASSLIPVRRPCFDDATKPPGPWNPHVTIGYFRVGEDAVKALEWARQFVGQKLSGFEWMRKEVEKKEEKK